ncbi:MAG: hypothetical protein IJ615_00500 [Bacteroidaceae bacterium]|nr:hypothetical protein [Bacteroidaceae bacterium]
MQYELFSDADFRQESPFAQRSVCLLGTFRTASRTLQKRLHELGADIKQAPSRGLHYAVLGKDVPAEARERLDGLAYHGFRPRVLSESDLDDIFAGHYSPYVVPAQTVKDLRLTLQHYLRGQLNYGGSMNPLYTKELYLSPDVSPDLYQQLGNRGIYANAYIDDTTDVLVISDASLQRLREGQTDDSLRYIEQQYNKSRSQMFRYVMTSEGELVAWLDRTSPRC